MSVTHVAGMNLTVEGKYFRQRCSWCGETLVEYDLTRTEFSCLSDNEAPASITGFKVGALVRKDGGLTINLDQEKLPDDACGLMPEWRP